MQRDNTSDICAVDMEQISIWLENNSRNEITEIMNNSKSTANALELCKRHHTDGVYADDTGQITM